METLILEGSTINPRVFFEPRERMLEISGYSRPENVRDFYMPLIQWIEEYKDWILEDQNSNESIEPITFKFKYIYFNSSSAKFIHDIMVVLGDMQKSNIPIKVYWFFDEDDDELREAGEELSDMANIPFHYVEVNRM
ncbi:MAG: hypothetical protein CVT95_12620 [Bacteroidetes bacterium HGW-Bacteroidetes-12]|nr:MAG: hypothetical protein CVT95_12620 [Bacteroidetes bacterium HGW-Bacteroidetes-12]